MRPDFTTVPKAAPGDRVAVVSPSFAAPGAFPAVHELTSAAAAGCIPCRPPRCARP